MDHDYLLNFENTRDWLDTYEVSDWVSDLVKFKMKYFTDHFVS